MLGQPPLVPEGIHETPGPVAPELILQRHDLLATGVNGLLPGRIHVLAVDEEADRRAAEGSWGSSRPWSGISSPSMMIESPILISACMMVPSGAGKPHPLFGAQRLLVEVDRLGRPGHEEAGGDGMIALGYGCVFLAMIASCYGEWSGHKSVTPDAAGQAHDLTRAGLST